MELSKHRRVFGQSQNKKFGRTISTKLCKLYLVSFDFAQLAGRAIVVHVQVVSATPCNHWSDHNRHFVTIFLMHLSDPDELKNHISIRICCDCPKSILKLRCIHVIPFAPSQPWPFTKVGSILWLESLVDVGNPSVSWCVCTPLEWETGVDYLHQCQQRKCIEILRVLYPKDKSWYVQRIP